MEKIVETAGKAVVDLFSNIWALLCGFFTVCVGYFAPVFDIVLLLIFLFIVDVILGYCAAKKLRGEKFSKTIIWKTTMPRMLVSVVLILCFFMWDMTYKQDFVCTYRIVGWFISGIIIYSIAQNGYSVTKWEGFPLLGMFLRKKIKDNTGIDIKEDGKL